MLQELLLEFLAQLDMQVKAITAALAEANSGVVCQVAHSIKGGAAVLSAHSLMSAAAFLEELGKSGDLPEGEDSLLMLEREVARLRCYCKGVANNDA